MKPNGPAIKAFRDKIHLGGREVARRAGISHQFLVRIESGQRGASSDVLGRLAVALDVPVEAITSTPIATAERVA